MGGKRGSLSTLALLTLTLALVSAVRAEDGFFDSNGVKIHYMVQGDGEPIILIHGYTANAQMNWSLPGVIDLLSKNYKVIALDNRGHGLSDKPEQPEEYGIKMVEDAVGLLDHLKIERAHVVGYSMGGMITMKLLSTHPERVISAIVGGWGWLQPHPRLAERYDDDFKRETNKALIACRRSWVQLAMTPEEVKSIKTPTMVLIGGNDPIRKENVEPLRELRPDIPVTIVAEANHVTCLGKPEFKTSIEDFINKNSKKK